MKEQIHFDFAWSIRTKSDPVTLIPVNDAAAEHSLAAGTWNIFPEPSKSFCVTWSLVFPDYFLY
jgi:hypothetical protein